MLIAEAGPLIRTHATNATDTSFPTRIPTITQPATGQGVFEMLQAQKLRGDSYNAVKLIPFSVCSDDDTADMQVILWNREEFAGDPLKKIWVPTKICQLALTFSSSVGVANGNIGTSSRFADTLAITMGNAAFVLVHSPVATMANTPGFAVVYTLGAQLVEVVFDQGNGTSINCLYQKLNLLK